MHFLSAFSPHSTADVWHWVCLAWEGERGMNKEKSHMQGYIFLNFFFLFLALKAKQKKGGRKKSHCNRETKKPQDHNFPEQNKLLETARKCHFMCECSTSLLSFSCLSNSWSHHKAQPSPTQREEEQAREGANTLLFQPNSWSCLRKL